MRSLHFLLAGICCREDLRFSRSDGNGAGGLDACAARSLRGVGRDVNAERSLNERTCTFLGTRRKRHGCCENGSSPV